MPGAINENYDNLKVLLVEDNAQVMRLIRMVLRQMGVTQIYTAKDGREAIEFLDGAPELINCIVSDWNMPHMNGFELLSQVRTTHPDMPFLMLTARHTLEDVKAAKDRGVMGYLAKPLVPEQLEEKIRVISRLLNQKQVKEKEKAAQKRYGVPRF